jgi:ABC-type multidrug transport system fused ATPase/permease subunit
MVLCFVFVNKLGSSGVKVWAINYLIEILGLMVSSTLGPMYAVDPLKFKTAGMISQLLFTPFPVMNLFNGIFFTACSQAIAQKSQVDTFGSSTLSDTNGGPYSQYGARIEMIGMIGCIILYGSLVMIFLLGCCNASDPKNDELSPALVESEDKLVKQERKRINETINEGYWENDANQDVLKVLNLVKKYREPDPTPMADPDLNQSVRSDRPITEMIEGEDALAASEIKKQKEGTMAVKGVSFGVKRGEIFALLGVNGAGKSSTFKCMTGDETISGGQIQLMDKQIAQLYQKPWLLDRVAGYVPQYDCIEHSLTVL